MNKQKKKKKLFIHFIFTVFEEKCHFETYKIEIYTYLLRLFVCLWNVLYSHLHKVYVVYVVQFKT